MDEENKKNSDKSLPKDLLGHEDLAGRVLELLEGLPDGPVVMSLEGDWGRGKTDLLERLYYATDEHFRIWVNPWANRDSLILETLAKVQEATGKRPKKELLAKTVSYLAAPARIAIRTAQVLGVVSNPTMAAPIKTGGDALENGISSLEEYLDLRQSEAESKPGRLFADIVEAIIQEEPSRKVLIFIDDMDRCTPEAQVDLLEQIHAFTQAQAKVTFFVAIDSTTLSNSIRNYYGSSFDGHLYLEKIFTLRLHLPQLTEQDLQYYLRPLLAEVREWLKEHNTSLKLDEEDLVEIFLKLGRRATPRLIERILLKTRYLLRGELPDGEVNFMLFWLSLSQAFPELRRLYLHLSGQGECLVDTLFEQETKELEVFPGRRNTYQVIDKINIDALRGNLALLEGVELFRLGSKMVSENSERFDKQVRHFEKMFRDAGLF